MVKNKLKKVLSNKQPTKLPTLDETGFEPVTLEPWPSKAQSKLEIGTQEVITQ